MRPAVTGVDVPSRAQAPVNPDDRALDRGILVIRWAVLTWMVVVTVSATVGSADRSLPVGVLGVAAAWVAWLTARGAPRTLPVLGVDLVVSACVLVAGLLNPWFATVFPVTAALAWGAARGAARGIAAGAALGAVAIVGALLIEVAPQRQSLIALLRDPVYFVLAGGGMGFVADLLRRAAARVEAARTQLIRATEQAARATERESLGRQIHDSVLQSLAMVQKRGRELATQQRVEGTAVAELVELTRAQERSLRALIFEPAVPQADDGVTHALRTRLEHAAAAVEQQIAITVSTVGHIRLPQHHADEVVAAVEQALANVARHSGASRVWLLAELDGEALCVTVRDDGRGFVFDPAALRAAGKFGLLHSIAGRAQDLDGSAVVRTSPGHGTEIELRIPVPPTHDAQTGA